MYNGTSLCNFFIAFFNLVLKEEKHGVRNWQAKYSCLKSGIWNLHSGKVWWAYYDLLICCLSSSWEEDTFCSFLVSFSSMQLNVNCKKTNMYFLCKIGIIGGTGLDDPDILEGRTEKYVDTPYGKVCIIFLFITESFCQFSRCLYALRIFRVVNECIKEVLAQLFLVAMYCGVLSLQKQSIIAKIMCKGHCTFSHL